MDFRNGINYFPKADYALQSELQGKSFSELSSSVGCRKFTNILPVTCVRAGRRDRQAGMQIKTQTGGKSGWVRKQRNLFYFFRKMQNIRSPNTPPSPTPTPTTTTLAIHAKKNEREKERGRERERRKDRGREGGKEGEKGREEI